MRIFLTFQRNPTIVDANQAELRPQPVVEVDPTLDEDKNNKLMMYFDELWNMNRDDDYQSTETYRKTAAYYERNKAYFNALDRNTEKQPMEGNAFSGALAAAKLKGDKEFKVGDKEYDVKEEEECDECGSGYMEEDKDMFENMLRGKRKHSYVAEDKVCEKCGKEICECGSGYMEEEDMTENKQMCNECGGMMNEEGMCNECGTMMYESKKKTLRLSETELITLITKMVSESIPPITKTAQDINAKQNKEAMDDVDKKMKDYLSFDGNDNPEFPKAIGKGEKVARKNTPDQEDEIAKNFAGLENLDYDIEPSEQFKKRLKMAIEGDKLMGNAPTTEKTDVKPSNGAKLGEEPKDKDGNSIPTPETAKKIEKQVKDRAEDKKNRVLYDKEAVPTNESKVSFSNVLLEEINKMKKFSEYNKKTQ